MLLHKEYTLVVASVLLFGALAGHTHAQPAPGSPRRFEPRKGRVLVSADAEVVVGLGRDDGLREGDHVAFFSEHRDSLGDGETAVLRERLYVGEVVALSRARARVRVGIGEVVPVGTLAQISDDPLTRSTSSPPRPRGIFQGEIMLRPFLSVGRFGGGVLGELDFDYRFEAPWHVQALVEPIAFAAGRDSVSVLAASAALLAGFDSKFFEIGGGLGAQTINGPADNLEPGSGLILQQYFRAGASDGSNFEARGTVALFHSEFEFRGITIEAQFALPRGVWITLGGSGGDVGAARAELGVKALLSGHGSHGSTFLELSLGYATMFKNAKCEKAAVGFRCDASARYEGPMLGVGAAYRP